MKAPFNANSAVFWLVAATLVWAATGISFKYFMSLGYAFFFVLVVSRMLKFLSVWFMSYYRLKKREQIKNAREFFIIFLNACFSVGTPVFFVLALNYTSVSNAYFLQYTMPAWVLVVAVLALDEKITVRKLAGLALTIGGIAIIAAPQAAVQLNLGFIFGILSAFSHTGDIITSRELKGFSYHTISVYSNFLQMLIAAAISPFVFGLPSTGLETLPLLSFAAIGVMLGIASDMYYHALQKLEASNAAIISFAELIFVGVLAFMLFGEQPGGNEVVGYALILCAGAIIILRKTDIARFERLLWFTDKM